MDRQFDIRVSGIADGITLERGEVLRALTE
jgi:hypothetical protein